MRKAAVWLVLLGAACGDPELRLEKIRFSNTTLLRVRSTQVQYTPPLHATIDVTYPRQWRDARVSVTCALTGPGIDVPQKLEQSAALPSGRTSTSWNLTFQPPPRGWVAGRYDVACNAGTSSVKGNFDVREPGSLLPPPREEEGKTADASTLPSFSLSLVPKLFASDEPNGKPVAEGDTFDAATLKYATLELGMPTLPVSYSLSDCVFVRALTGVVQFPIAATRIDGDSNATYVGSVGYGTPGQWLPGEYGVRCNTENVEVERRTFRVVGRPNADLRISLLGNRLPIKKASAATIQFLEYLDEPPPIGQRQYGTVFVGAARYIGTEVKITLEPANAPRPFRYRCHYFTDRGQLLGQASVELQIPAGLREYWMWVSWGSRDGRYWRSGTYFVECDSDGAFLASRYFQIER